MDITMHYSFTVVGPNKSEKKIRNVLQIDYKLKIKDKMGILHTHTEIKCWNTKITYMQNYHYKFLQKK